MSETPNKPPNPILRVRVAHFVDAQGDQPEGVRAIEPPADTRQALRGNLYAIVELTGDNPARHELSERMLSAIQRTYYTAKGSQADVMRQAVASARQKAAEFNEYHPDQPVGAGIICVGLIQSRLLMLHSGPALALIAAGPAVDRYPTDLLNFDTSEAAATAAAFYRQDIAQGASLFLGGAEWLNEVPIRTLAATVAHINIANCGEAARGLREQYRIDELPGILVVIEPVGGATAAGAPPAASEPGELPRSDAQSASGAQPGRAESARPTPPDGLPTAVHATPPVRDLPLEDDAAGRVAQPDISATAFEPPSDVGLTGTRQAAVEVEETPPADTSAGGAALLAGAGAAVAAGAQSGARKTRDALANFLPDRTRTRTPQASTAAPTLEAPEPARGGRARLFVLLALLILLLVPIVVMAVSWGQGSSTRAEAESLVDLSASQVSAAQGALDAGDGETARMQLEAALDNLASAELLVGATPEIDRIRAQIERDLQDILQIRPLNALVAPLIRFPADALPTRVINVDQDIYVLDGGRGLVERYRLDANQEFVPDPTGQTVLAEGAAVDGVTVGPLADMAWQPAVPGFQDRPGLLVLDRNNNFFRYDPRVEGASYIELGDPTALQFPNQIETYSGRTYVADAGVQQILRYEPGQFNLTPTPWFAEQTAANLTGLQRMAIDGDIWLLYPTGIVLRYNQGESVPFSVKGSVARIDDPIDMAVGQQTDILYIADAAGERIFAFDKNGDYLAQYIAPEPGQLVNLRGLYLDDVAGRLFILTQSSLFQVPPPG